MTEMTVYPSTVQTIGGQLNKPSLRGSPGHHCYTWVVQIRLVKVN